MASSLHLLSRLVFFMLVVCSPAVCSSPPGGNVEHVSSASQPDAGIPAR
jgi:hypothetical protein